MEIVCKKKQEDNDRHSHRFIFYNKQGISKRHDDTELNDDNYPSKISECEINGKKRKHLLSESVQCTYDEMLSRYQTHTHPPTCIDYYVNVIFFPHSVFILINFCFQLLLTISHLHLLLSHQQQLSTAQNSTRIHTHTQSVIKYYVAEFPKLGQFYLFFHRMNAIRSKKHFEYAYFNSLNIFFLKNVINFIAKKIIILYLILQRRFFFFIRDVKRFFVQNNRKVRIRYI